MEERVLLQSNSLYRVTTKMSLILSVVAMKTLMISFIKRLVSMMGISPLQRKVLTH